MPRCVEDGLLCCCWSIASLAHQPVCSGVNARVDAVYVLAKREFEMRTQQDVS